MIGRNSCVGQVFRFLLIFSVGAEYYGRPEVVPLVPHRDDAASRSIGVGKGRSTLGNRESAEANHSRADAGLSASCSTAGVSCPNRFPALARPTMPPNARNLPYGKRCRSWAWHGA